jgi:hypothetical protein
MSRVRCVAARARWSAATTNGALSLGLAQCAVALGASWSQPIAETYLKRHGTKSEVLDESERWIKQVLSQHHPGHTLQRFDLATGMDIYCLECDERLATVEAEKLIE